MQRSEARRKPSLRKRLIIVVTLVVVLFALLIGFNTFKGVMIGRFMQSMASPPQTVSTMKVGYLTWQPSLEAFGNVRAVHGADLAFDVSGLVDDVKVKSGADVRKGQVLVDLVDDHDRATLEALRAMARLAQVTEDRARRQVAVQAISRADYDAAAADFANARAQVAAQAALVAKKTLRAPFAGRIGIITANPGQYVNAGATVVTLQQLDPVYVDFHAAQSALVALRVGSKVEIRTDTFGGKVFAGTISAIDPKIDVDTRNVRVEAALANPDQRLIPGMFTQVAVASGPPRRYLTVPQTAVTYAPYGNTVFVVHPGRPPENGVRGTPVSDKGAVSTAQAAPGQDGSADKARYVTQVLVETGATRGDQVAIVSGLHEGDVIVTSGQLKLDNGTPVNINNKVQPAFDPDPHPKER